MLTENGECLSQDDVAEMLAMCPRSKDGLLDYQAFVHVVEDASSTVKLLKVQES